MKNIIIKTDGNELVITYLYDVDNYFTFNIKIKSGEFSGISNFCIFNKDIIVYIKLLSTMSNELKGACKITDSDSDSYITIEMQKFGHICISGQIGGSHEDHSVKFKYISDQTILDNLINTFKEVL